MTMRTIVLIVVLALALSAYLPLVSENGSSKVISGFSGGASVTTLTFTTAGRNDSAKISIGATEVVKSAYLNVTNGQYAGEYPTAPGLDIGEDGDSEWMFTGQGYGDFGHQYQFSNEKFSKDFNLLYSADAGQIRLPADAQVTSAHLSVRGNFDPTFEKEVAYPDGLDIGRCLDSGDVNKDGYDDILTVEPIEYGEIAWYENPKTLSDNWQKHVIVVLPYPYYAQFEDMEGDGDLDVIVSNNNWNAGIRWYNNTQGTGLAWREFNINKTFSYAGSFDLADVSGDGLDDVVVLADYYNFGRLCWIEQPTNLTKNWTTHLINNTVVSMAYLKAGDFDGDGNVDIALTSDGGAGIRGLYLIKGPNDPFVDPWVGKKLWDINYPEEVEITDVDSDLHPDIIIAFPGASRVTWFESPDLPFQDPWVWHNLTTAVSGARGCPLYDMDTDGDLDILTAGVYSDKIYWLEHPTVATNAWTLHEVPSVIYSPYCIIPFDMDNAGREDLAVTGLDFSQLTVFRENGGNYQQFNAVNFSTYTPNYLTVGNFDGVYGDDVAYISFTGNVLALRKPGLDPTANWTLEIIDPTLYYPMGVNATDMDGDGDLDLVACTYYGHDIYWYENKHTETPSTPWLKRKVVEDTPDGYYRYLITQDIDGKNATDIITYERWDDGSNDARNCLVWYEAPADPRNASQKWYRHVIADRLQNVYSFAMGDIDGDGIEDIVFQQYKVVSNVYYGNVSWARHPSDYLSTLKPWTTRVITTLLQYPNDVECFDIDNDGREDVVVTDYLLDTLFWIKTPQDPTVANPLWNMYTVAANINACWRVECADLGNDGHADLAVTDYWSNEVRWYIAPPDPVAAINWPAIQLDNMSVQSYDIKFGHFSSDELPDLIVGCFYPGRLLWYDLKPLYPASASLDVGKDSVADWAISNMDVTQISPDLKDAFNSVMKDFVLQVDPYGNKFVDVAIGLTGSDRNASMFDIDITYTVTVQISGSKMIQEIEQYITAHGGAGQVEVPIDTYTSSPGVLVLSSMVLNTNEAPRFLKPIPDNLTLEEDNSVTNLLELRDYFEDDYTQVNSLTFGIVNYTNPQYVDVGLTSGHMLSVDATLTENWYGRTTICVFAKDLDGFITNSDLFNVTILPVNDEPIAGPDEFSPISMDEGSVIKLNMSAKQYFTDVDSTQFYYTTDIDQQLPAIRENLSVVFEAATNLLTVTAKDGWTITGLVLKIYCDDDPDVAATLYKNLQINVNNIYEPLAWAPLPIIEVQEDTEAEAVLDMDDYAQDLDHMGSPITFTITSVENSSYVDVTMNLNNTLNVRAHDNFFGDSIVTIEARNQFSSTDASLYITVLPVNDAPVFLSQSPDDGSVVSNSNVFFSWEAQDVDKDALTYSFFLDTGTATTLVVAGLTEPRYTMTSLKDNTTYEWRVSASDGQATVLSSIYYLVVSSAQILQYKIEVSYDEQITVPPGTEKVIYITVKNTGDASNYAVLWVDSTSPEINDLVYIVDESKPVQMNSGQSRDIPMVIDFTTFTGSGKFYVEFFVQNGMTKETTKYNVTVNTEKKDDRDGTLSALYFIVPLIIILLVIIVIVVVIVLRRKKAKEESPGTPKTPEEDIFNPPVTSSKTALQPELERDLTRSLGTIRKTPGAAAEPEVLEPEVEDGPPLEGRPQDVIDVEAGPNEPKLLDTEAEASPEMQTWPMNEAPEETAPPEEVQPEPKQEAKVVQTRYSYSYAKRGKGAKPASSPEPKASEGEALPELAPIEEEHEHAAPAKPRSAGSEKYKKKGKGRQG